MSKTLIRNATCVFPDETCRANVLLADARIASVDAPATARADQIIDATGMHLLPGVIDDQVHFRDPGLTHKEDLRTGTMAAARGGVTTVLEMPNTRPATISRDRLRQKLELAAKRCVVNYGFYLGATPENVAELCTVDASTTPGIKIFIGSSTGDLLVDEQDALERIFAETRLPITAHCEDEQVVQKNAAKLHGGQNYADHSRIRDHQAAVIATQRALDLAFRHRHRFHVLHMSTAQETELVRDHRNLITAEVCPHHLFFTIDDYERLGSLVQMNPSVKTHDDIDALWTALQDGRIQIIATDHAPHTLKEKQQPYPQSPSGIPAVENSLALMLNEVNRGRCSIEQVVHWMSNGPARVWDIVDKGWIAEGFDADLVLVDLQRTETIRNEYQISRCGWSPWHGVTLTGWPARTFVLGKTVYHEGMFDESVRAKPAVFDHARGGYWATAESVG